MDLGKSLPEDETREQLLAERISDEELRELLRRLGEAEFGGSEQATVGAVVEATGCDAADVGRILGDIRREAFDRKFGLELRAHEQRIERLEDVTERIESRPAPSKPSNSGNLVSMTDEEVEVMAELVDKRRLEKAFQPFGIALLLLVGFILLIVVVTQNATSAGHKEPEAWTTTTDGRRVPVHMYKDKNGQWDPDLNSIQ